MADKADDSTQHERAGQRTKPRRPGRPKCDVTPWLLRMAAISLDHDPGSVLKLAEAAVRELGDSRGPCASRKALVALLRGRWRTEAGHWMNAELRNGPRAPSVDQLAEMLTHPKFRERFVAALEGTRRRAMAAVPLANEIAALERETKELTDLVEKRRAERGEAPTPTPRPRHFLGWLREAMVFGPTDKDGGGPAESP